MLKRLRIFFPIGLIILTLSCAEKPLEYKNFNEYPVYDGDDLGLIYSPEESKFKLWSPTARTVVLHLYEEGDGDSPLETFSLSKSDNGIWSISVQRDLNGLFYTFQINDLKETPGIYAKAVGVNGMRAAILDLNSTDPADWKEDKRPGLESVNDIILYEMHVRDITTHKSSGSTYPGKFLGLIEEGTVSPEGLATGIDHIKELGVTHVHLLPSFDNYSIDESKLDSAQFNWGYDPQNYNVPEGSFSSNPYDPAIRIREFKEMVKGFHDNGLRVILDVVYNHTGRTEDSNFNLEVPKYYYRLNEDGSWSDAASCGNETASDRAMMRKYIIESCKYWIEEYHLDGFRFDLMGIHDIETMNLLSKELKKIDPSIYVYGEGWTAGGSPLPDERKAIKSNTVKLDDIAAFSDDLRDGLKGSVFVDEERGFVSGAKGTEESIKFGIVASTRHPQVDYTKVNYSAAPWANKPAQCINYVSCHDNHTLYDKLLISTENGTTEKEIEQMHKMALAIVLTSQGVPFLHAGTEMMRTKGGEHNSYNLPDSVNQIRWENKNEKKQVVDYVKGLIELRKAHPAFKMKTTEDIVNNLKFIETDNSGVVAYSIDAKAAGDTWGEVVVIFNANKQAVTMGLPKGDWTLVVNGKNVMLSGIKKVTGGQIDIDKLSTWILYK